jgi:hypothetical protein
MKAYRLAFIMIIIADISMGVIGRFGSSQHMLYVSPVF